MPPTQSKDRFLRVQTFLSATFLVPFVAGSLLAYWVSAQAPGRFQARMVLSVPRPQVEGDEAFLATRNELAPLRIFFRSAERMQSALSAIGRHHPRNEVSPEARLLAHQTSLRTLPARQLDRMLVEVRLWATESDVPSGVLRFLGEELERRSNRAGNLLPGKIEQAEQRVGDQMEVVGEKAEALKEFLAGALGERPDIQKLGINELLDEESWLVTLRQGLKGNRLPEGRSEWELPSLTVVRHKFRNLRQALGDEVEILEAMRKDVGELTDRLESTQISATTSLSVVFWPSSVSTQTNGNPIALGVLCCSVGGLVASLALFLKLMISPATPGRPARVATRPVTPQGT